MRWKNKLTKSELRHLKETLPTVNFIVQLLSNT